MMTQAQTFAEWMARIDKILESRFGLTSRDLPDQCYRDEYEAGTSPLEAIRIALDAEGWDE